MLHAHDIKSFVYLLGLKNMHTNLFSVHYSYIKKAVMDVLIMPPL